MTQTDELLLLTTGGTIDKEYFDQLSKYQVTGSSVPKLLSIARVLYPHKVEEVERKDSLDLTDEDRSAIVARVRRTNARRLVITHGTDTMTLTAAALTEIQGKTIVLVGSISPARFAESDAAFNLGMAFATAQIAPPGIYITMNGTVFRASEVRKDRDNNVFVRT